MLLRKSLATVLGAFLVLGAASTANAKELRFGSLAPKASHWGKVFDAWSQAVAKKSDGALTMKWDYNGAAGDEKAMIDKIASGQLDGAAVTSVGLAAVHKPFLALQMPGLCTDWGCVDRVRGAVFFELQQGANKEGFHLLGTGDVGLARTFSKGKAVKTPDDLKTMKVYAWKDDPAASINASVIGYTPVLSSVPGLLPALTSGQINVATVPSLAADQLQWAPHFDHVVDQVAGAAVGGLIMSKSRLDGIPADMQKMLKETGNKAGQMLTEKTREQDKKAYDRVKGRMTVVTLSKAEQDNWNAKFKDIRKRLGQGTYSAAWVQKLETLAGK
jgi:TRAP-type transport system periplasmic protein